MKSITTLQPENKKDVVDKVGYSTHFQRLGQIPTPYILSKKAGQIRTHNFQLKIPSQSQYLKNLDSELLTISEAINTSDEGSLINALIEFYKLGFIFVDKKLSGKELLDELSLNGVSDSNFSSKYAKDLKSLDYFLRLQVKRKKIKTESSHSDLDLSKKALLDSGKINYLVKVFFNKEFDQIKDDKLKTSLKEYLEQKKDFFCDFDSQDSKAELDNLKVFYEEFKKTFYENPKFSWRPAVKHAWKKAFSEDIPEDLFVNNISFNQTFIIYFDISDSSTFDKTQVERLQKFNVSQLYLQHFCKLPQIAGFKKFFDKKNMNKKEDSSENRLAKYLMGIDGNNNNGLSNFFGDTLVDFRKSDQKIREKIRASNPKLFDNDELLEWYCSKVKEIAEKIKNVPLTNRDNLFGGYRSHVAGKLSSWLSNFENRLDEFKEYFQDENIYQQIVDTVKSHVNQSLFSPAQFQLIEKLARDYVTLGDDFKALFEDSGNFHDLESRIKSHAEESQELRAILKRFQNEGIDINRHQYLKDFVKKSKNKAEDDDQESKLYGERDKYEWKEKFIPPKMKKWPAFFGEGRSVEEDLLRDAVLDLQDSSKKIFNILKNISSASLQEDDKKFSEPFDSKKDSRTFAEVQFKKTLSSLHSLYLRYGSSLLKNKLKEIFQFYYPEYNLDDSFLRLSTGESPDYKYLFYVSPHSKVRTLVKDEANCTIKGFGKSNLIELAAELEELINFAAAFDSSKFYDLKDFYQLDDNGFATEESLLKAEILKVYLGLKFRLIKESLDFSDIFIGIPEKDFPDSPSDNKRFYANRELVILREDLRDSYLKNADKQFLTKFIQSSICSKLKASLTLLSKREYIKNHTISIESDDVFNLRYVCVDESRFAEARHDIGIKLDTLRFQRKTASKIENVAINRKIRKLKAALERLKKAEEKNINSSNYSNKINTDDIKQILRGKNFDKESKCKLAESPHRWELVIKSATEIGGISDYCIGTDFKSSGNKKEKAFLEKQEQIEDEIYLMNKNGKTVKKISKNLESGKDYYYSLPIDTSVYQKQFLDKFLYGFKGDLSDLEIQLSQISLIWKVKYKLISLKKIYESLDSDQSEIKPESRKEYSLFASIPFQIVNESENESKVDFLRKGNLSNEFRGQEERLLGIDLGEYGFGWAVYNTKEMKIEKHGFHRVQLLDSLRKQVYDWKDSQSVGSFYSADTKIARLREHATGQIRNKIHQLVMKYRARPIYELEVDCFESGSEKIKKLYKSIKRSDTSVQGDNDADKQIRKHIWGTEKNIAKTISAPYTSKISRKTGKISLDDRMMLEVSPEDVYHAFNWKGLSCKERANEKKYTRPFGGQAIYVESGSMCLADVQAAQNIAIKYFLKFASEFKEKRLHFYKLYHLMKYLKDSKDETKREEALISKFEPLRDVYNSYSISASNIDFFSNQVTKSKFGELLESSDLYNQFDCVLNHLQTSRTDKKSSNKENSNIISIIKMKEEEYHKSKKTDDLPSFPINSFFVYLADELKDENFTTKDAEITGFTHKGFDKLVQEKVKSLNLRKSLK